MSTVLVIDDDPKFLNEAELMLVTAGYRVLRAADGFEAVAILDKKSQEIDLAIVDLALPGVNGFEIIGAMARRPNSVKIIATTAVYRDNFLATAGTLGAHAAIRKPPAGKPLPQRDWLETVSRLIGDGKSDKRGRSTKASGAGGDSELTDGTETKH